MKLIPGLRPRRGTSPTQRDGRFSVLVVAGAAAAGAVLARVID